MYYMTLTSRVVDGVAPPEGAHESKSDWIEVDPAPTIRPTGNGGSDASADGETSYVDSMGDNGQGGGGGMGPPVGNNDPGYVEGKNNGGKHGGGVRGDSGSENAAVMVDRPGWPSTQAAKDFFDQYKPDVSKDKPFIGSIRVIKMKMRLDFRAYLVCNNAVVAKIEWWWEGVYDYESGSVHYSKGITDGPRAANSYEDADKDALDDWNNGGRNGGTAG